MDLLHGADRGLAPQHELAQVAGTHLVQERGGALQRVEVGRVQGGRRRGVAAEGCVGGHLPQGRRGYEEGGGGRNEGEEKQEQHGKI
jgi:hypothetical protein